MADRNKRHEQPDEHRHRKTVRDRTGPPRLPRNQTWTCGYCGREIEDGDRCDSCGARQ